MSSAKDPSTGKIVDIVRKYVLFTEGILSVILNLAVLGVILWRRGLLFNASGVAVLILTVFDIANACATLYGNIRFFLGEFGNHPHDCDIRGSTTSFFIFSAIWMIAILAYSRYDAVASRNGAPKPQWYFAVLGGVPMLIMLIFSIVIAANLKFYKMPIGRCMLVDPEHKDPLRMTAQIFRLFFLILTLIMVTFCYTSIAVVHRRVLKKVTNLPLSELSNASKGSGYHEEIKEVNTRKLNKKVYFKVAIMLFAYYLCLVPTAFFEIYELIVWKVRSIIADAITASLLLFLGVINPIMVLVLHEQIKLAMQEILFSIRKSIFRY